MGHSIPTLKTKAPLQGGGSFAMEGTLSISPATATMAGAMPAGDRASALALADSTKPARPISFGDSQGLGVLPAADVSSDFRNDGLYDAFPDIEETADDRLLGVWYSGNHHIDPESKIWGQFSDKWGQNWQDPFVVAEHVSAGVRGPGICKMKSGLLVLSAFIYNGRHYSDQGDYIAPTVIQPVISWSRENGVQGSWAELKTVPTGLDWAGTDGEVVEALDGSLVLFFYAHDGALNDPDSLYSIVFTINDDESVTWETPSLVLAAGGGHGWTETNAILIEREGQIAGIDRGTWILFVRDDLAGGSNAGFRTTSTDLISWTTPTLCLDCAAGQIRVKLLSTGVIAACHRQSGTSRAIMSYSWNGGVSFTTSSTTLADETQVYSGLVSRKGYLGVLFACETTPVPPSPTRIRFRTFADGSYIGPTGNGYLPKLFTDPKFYGTALFTPTPGTDFLDIAHAGANVYHFRLTTAGGSTIEVRTDSGGALATLLFAMNQSGDWQFGRDVAVGRDFSVTRDLLAGRNVDVRGELSSGATAVVGSSLFRLDHPGANSYHFICSTADGSSVEVRTDLGGALATLAYSFSHHGDLASGRDLTAGRNLVVGGYVVDKLGIGVTPAPGIIFHALVASGRGFCIRSAADFGGGFTGFSLDSLNNDATVRYMTGLAGNPVQLMTPRFNVKAIPTSDPHVDGELWNNGGVPNISAG